MPLSPGTTAFLNDISHAVDLIVQNNLQQKARLSKLQQLEQERKIRAEEARKKVEADRDNLFAKYNLGIAGNIEATPESREQAALSASQILGQPVEPVRPITMQPPPTMRGKINYDIPLKSGIRAYNDYYDYIKKGSDTSFNFFGQKVKLNTFLKGVDRNKQTAKSALSELKKDMRNLEKLKAEDWRFDSKDPNEVNAAKKEWSEKKKAILEKIQNYESLIKTLDKVSGQITTVKSWNKLDPKLRKEYLRIIGLLKDEDPEREVVRDEDIKKTINPGATQQTIPADTTSDKGTKINAAEEAKKVLIEALNELRSLR